MRPRTQFSSQVSCTSAEGTIATEVVGHDPDSRNRDAAPHERKLGSSMQAYIDCMSKGLRTSTYDEYTYSYTYSTYLLAYCPFLSYFRLCRGALFGAKKGALVFEF